tara:strand:- start:2709 stop:3614 length:906 start_codon:yes stop_codon:yes gene_type:complete
MDIFKGFDLKPGTGMQMGIQGAGALLSGWQAKRAKVDYGNKMNEIKAYELGRQKITNAFGALENPYKNLAVATQAAEIQMEQTDQALATTLDYLRATGAAGGGATALANAALKSKQGVSASIEQQEVNNQKLQAQGQLQVDIAKGKGEIRRMEMQEVREVSQLDRLQSQADLLRAQQLESQSAMISGIGGMGKAFTAGMVSQDRENPNAKTGVNSGFDDGLLARNRNSDKAYSDLMSTDLNKLVQEQEDLGGSDIEPVYEDFSQLTGQGSQNPLNNLSLNTNVDDDNFIPIISLEQASQID